MPPKLGLINEAMSTLKEIASLLREIRDSLKTREKVS